MKTPIKHKGYTITWFPMEGKYMCFTSKHSMISGFIDTEEEAIKYINDYLDRIEKSKIKTIFQQVQELEIEFDNHESDLYIPVNKVTTRLIDVYDFKQNVATFRNELNGKQWYDIPFAYDTFWKKA